MKRAEPATAVPAEPAIPVNSTNFHCTAVTRISADTAVTGPTHQCTFYESPTITNTNTNNCTTSTSGMNPTYQAQNTRQRSVYIQSVVTRRHYQYRDGQYFDVGQMGQKLNKSNALHFSTERVINTSQRSPQFLECCQKGLVNFLTQNDPSLLLRLFLAISRQYQ